MRSAEYRLGLLLVTVSAVAWSTAGLFTRLIPLDSWTMLAWRGIFGAIGIAAVILVMERRNTVESFTKNELAQLPPRPVRHRKLGRRAA